MEEVCGGLVASLSPFCLESSFLDVCLFEKTTHSVAKQPSTTKLFRSLFAYASTADRYGPFPSDGNCSPRLVFRGCFLLRLAPKELFSSSPPRPTPKFQLQTDGNEYGEDLPSSFAKFFELPENKKVLLRVGESSQERKKKNNFSSLSPSLSFISHQLYCFITTELKFVIAKNRRRCCEKRKMKFMEIKFSPS